MQRSRTAPRLRSAASLLIAPWSRYAAAPLRFVRLLSGRVLWQLTVKAPDGKKHELFVNSTDLVAGVKADLQRKARINVEQQQVKFTLTLSLSSIDLSCPPSVVLPVARADQRSVAGELRNLYKLRADCSRVGSVRVARLAAVADFVRFCLSVSARSSVCIRPSTGSLLRVSSGCFLINALRQSVIANEPRAHAGCAEGRLNHLRRHAHVLRCRHFQRW